MDTKQAGDTTHQTSEGSTSSIDSVQEFSSTKKSYASERAKPGLPSGNAMKLARGLGWFSIGLGLTELLCPKVIASISGVSKQRTGLIRLYGLREITSGIAIFTQQKPTEALWSRVAGDAMDLASLGLAFTSSDAKRGRLAFATANVLAVTALDIMCAQQLSNDNKGIHAQATCIVNQPPEQVYQFWRDFQNQTINRAAADWLLRNNDLNEPWVFVIGPDGKIVARFDNVTTAPELTAVLDKLPPT